jgi:nicotinate-nucleotide--dimethylbenzimidazole phosphoribosyltransferase
MTALLHLTALDDILCLDLTRPDAAAATAARARQAQLTKPPGSLGRLEDLAAFMAGWQGTERPWIDRAQALIFAGNHGICAQGVNPFPQDVTALMVANFEAGGAAINQLCRVAGADLSVVALDLDRPTEDYTKGSAMTSAECLDALMRGSAAVDRDADILILGEMGIGNSTVSAALAHAVCGGVPDDWVGRGTGSDENGLALKREVVARGVARHGGLPPLHLLPALGGRTASRRRSGPPRSLPCRAPQCRARSRPALRRDGQGADPGSGDGARRGNRGCSGA